MPTRRYYSNTPPQRMLSVSLTSSGTSATVTGTFAGWPTNFPYFAFLELGSANSEIVSVTGVTGSVATIVRGQNGTVAVAHSGGATFDQGVIAQDFDEANAHTSANTGVHGISGHVVGDSDAQTLTNKTLTSPAISNPTVTGTSNGANATLSGTLAVTGTSTLTGAVSTTNGVTVGTTLGVTGAVTASSTLAVTGNETVGGTLVVTGQATIAGVNRNTSFFYGTEVTPVSLANGAYTKANIDTAVVNPGAWSLSSGAVALPATGTYRASAVVGFASAANGSRGAELQLNGTLITGSQVITPGALAGAYFQNSGTVIFTANAGDLLTVAGFQNSGGAINSAAGGSITIERLA
jgi:hypothetical protein